MIGKEKKPKIVINRNEPKTRKDLPVYWDDKYIVVAKDVRDKHTGKLKIKLSVEIVAIEMCSRLIKALGKVQKSFFKKETWNYLIDGYITLLTSYKHPDVESKLMDDIKVEK